MAYALPIVATIEDGGVRFVVRAVPWGLARLARTSAQTDEAAVEFNERLYERCVEVADGEKPPIDDLPASLVNRLIAAAFGAGEENPPSPPPSTAPDSGG